jgi:hypothetical protein
MRWYILLFALFLGACEGSFFRPEHLGKKTSLEKSYAARDACLQKNAEADAGATADAQALAHTVAMACSNETDRLITAADRGDADPRIAVSIRKDSEFRALKYVMKARGQAIF